MRNRLFIILSVLAVLLAACAPASTATPPPVDVTEPPAGLLLPTATPGAVLETPAVGEPATEVSAPTALPVATSRGPDLHATDPSTVNLASGGLQFVEFFSFT
ncbi:MAG TPA: hypothetical protein VK897_18245 [Anaerolineales bacterium]|nr:hypothetical protein [Anaerolineales bacterium]